MRATTDQIKLSPRALVAIVLTAVSMGAGGSFGYNWLTKTTTAETAITVHLSKDDRDAIDNLSDKIDDLLQLLRKEKRR